MDTTLTSSISVPVIPTANPLGESPFRPLKQHLHSQEVAYIQRAIEYSGGDKKRAAQLLGISLATLYRKLEGE